MSNIGKRFAKPAEWEQPHFTDLNLKQRLFWLFLNNRCDLAGVYQLHYPVDSAYLGFTIDQTFVDSFTEAINSDSKRVKQLGGRRLWLTKFIRYQQVGQKRKVLSAKAPPHISIVNKLKEHELFADAVDNDPELFSEFTGEIFKNDSPDKSASNGSNNPNGRVSLDKPKGYSSSNSNSDSKSSDNGNSSNNSDSLNHSNGKSNTSEKKETYYQQLKQNVGGLAVLDLTSLGFEKDVDKMLEELAASEVQDSKTYLLEQVEDYDWSNSSGWSDFVYRILNREETPF